MDHDKTGCQAPPEPPILCINNCGFFRSAATMNMCSKCHKDLLLKEQQVKLAAASIGSIVNGTSGNNGNKPVVVTSNLDFQLKSPELKTISVQPSCASGSGQTIEAKPKEGGPNRCSSCKKRVGLTGFKCRCSNLYCATHRYSDKHDCQFDYRFIARDANPVVKAEKLHKF